MEHRRRRPRSGVGRWRQRDDCHDVLGTGGGGERQYSDGNRIVVADRSASVMIQNLMPLTLR